MIDPDNFRVSSDIGGICVQGRGRGSGGYKNERVAPFFQGRAMALQNSCARPWLVDIKTDKKPTDMNTDSVTETQKARLIPPNSPLTWCSQSVQSQCSSAQHLWQERR